MMEFELRPSETTHVFILPHHFVNLKVCSSENLITVSLIEKDRRMVVIFSRIKKKTVFALKFYHIFKPVFGGETNAGIIIHFFSVCYHTLVSSCDMKSSLW